jgi:hypothetical protein
MLWKIQLRASDTTRVKVTAGFLYRLDGATDAFLIVIDRRARQRGVVCAIDHLVGESKCTRAESTLVLAE